MSAVDGKGNRVKKQALVKPKKPLLVSLAAPEKSKLRAIGKFGKVPVPLNFVPGSIRRLTDSELKSAPAFEAKGTISEIETDREHTTAVQLGGSGTFRIRYHQRIFVVHYKAGYVSGPIFNVDGIDFDLDRL